MPTETLEELADREMADAIRRQKEDEVRDMEMANENPDAEEILERERKKATDHDNWKDFVPKGRGVTQRI
jgi:hypothetical protein